MVNINPINLIRIDLTGQILLTYKGENENHFGRRACKTGNLIIKHSRANKLLKKGAIIEKFELNFEEYFGRNLILNLLTKNCYLNDNNAVDPIEIGRVERFRLAVTNTHLIVSGFYNHKSITLAYYQYNQSKFGFMAPLEDKHLGRLSKPEGRTGETIVPIDDWRI